MCIYTQSWHFWFGFAFHMEKVNIGTVWSFLKISKCSSTCRHFPEQLLSRESCSMTISSVFGITNIWDFQRTLEICHWWQSVSIAHNEHAEIWPARKPAWRRGMKRTTVGKFIVAIVHRGRLLFLNKDSYVFVTMSDYFVKAKVVMWCTKCKLWFLNV